MKMFSANVILLVALSVAGCGTGAKGPANPKDTPVVTEAQKTEAMTKNMPPEAKKMYDKYKQGGS
jgi:predicted small lipoprotein YifL